MSGIFLISFLKIILYHLRRFSLNLGWWLKDTAKKQIRKIIYFKLFVNGFLGQRFGTHLSLKNNFLSLQTEKISAFMYKKIRKYVKNKKFKSKVFKVMFQLIFFSELVNSKYTN